MKRFKALYISSIVLIFICISCTQASKKTDTDPSNQDKVGHKNEHKTSNGDSIYNTSAHQNDSLKSVIKQFRTDTFEIPTFYDYESEYQLRYEHYINKAYDKKTYVKHYQPYTYQSKHLDSLIKEYDKKGNPKDSLR